MAETDTTQTGMEPLDELVIRYGEDLQRMADFYWNPLSQREEILGYFYQEPKTSEIILHKETYALVDVDISAFEKSKLAKLYLKEGKIMIENCQTNPITLIGKGCEEDQNLFGQVKVLNDHGKETTFYDPQAPESEQFGTIDFNGLFIQVDFEYKKGLSHVEKANDDLDQQCQVDIDAPCLVFDKDVVAAAIAAAEKKKKG